MGIFYLQYHTKPCPSPVLHRMKIKPVLTSCSMFSFYMHLDIAQEFSWMMLNPTSITKNTFEKCNLTRSEVGFSVVQKPVIRKSYKRSRRQHGKIACKHEMDFVMKSSSLFSQPDMQNFYFLSAEQTPSLHYKVLERYRVRISLVCPLVWHLPHNHYVAFQRFGTFPLWTWDHAGL